MLPLDSSFVAALVCMDERIAEDVRAGRCRVCGGALHLNCYSRKPRGVPPEWADYFDYRLSFTCSICNKRHTPPTVRFLGSRLYLAFVVILTCAVKTGLTDFRVKKLVGWFGVPRQTLARWCVWWREIFANGPFFKIERGRFPAEPPFEVATLPASLLARFNGDDVRVRLPSLLHFLEPITKRY